MIARITSASTGTAASSSGRHPSPSGDVGLEQCAQLHPATMQAALEGRLGGHE